MSHSQESRSRRSATPRFSLGHLVATRGSLEALELANQDPLSLLARHVVGDWGNIDYEDRQANERALVQGNRLLSAYTLADGVRIWIITEADRSSTTILLPGEY